MVAGRDKRWRSRRVDARTVRAARLVDTKRLVFVRHGESEWNRIFNVGPKALAPFKLAVAVVREAALLLRGDPGSVFLDAPLTTLGLEQAQAVAALLREPPAGPAAALELATLRGDATAPRTSVVVSSNLRRAAAWVVVGGSTNRALVPNGSNPPGGGRSYKSWYGVTPLRFKMLHDRFFA